MVSVECVQIELSDMDHSPSHTQGCARRIADIVNNYIGAVAGVAIFIALALVSPAHSHMYFPI